VKDRGKFAPSDAQAVTRAFDALPGARQTVLLTKDVSAGALRILLEESAKRTDVRIRDFRLFYAGPGTLVDAKGALEQALRFADGKTMTLAELLRLVDAVPAKTRTVLLDTGFYGQGGRAVSNPKLEAVEPAKISSFPQGKAGLCLLSGSGPNEPGFESGALKHGALTAFLLPLLSKKGDTNGDGVVKASELFPELSWSLSRKVSLPDGTGLHAHLSGDAVLWRYAVKKTTGKD